MESSNLKTMPVSERLEADYISFYRETESHTYYVIDQELQQVYEAYPTMNGVFNYVPVTDAELPGEVLQVVQDIRRRWLAA